MTPEEKAYVEEVKERDRKATIGPWYQKGPLEEEEIGIIGGVPVSVVFNQDEGDGEQSTFDLFEDLTEEDASFIANAKQDIPRLIQIIEKQEKVIEKLRESLEWYANTYKIYVVSKTNCGAVKISETENGFELLDGNRLARETLKIICEL